MSIIRCCTLRAFMQHSSDEGIFKLCDAGLVDADPRYLSSTQATSRQTQISDEAPFQSTPISMLGLIYDGNSHLLSAYRNYLALRLRYRFQLYIMTNPVSTSYHPNTAPKSRNDLESYLVLRING